MTCVRLCRGGAQGLLDGIKGQIGQEVAGQVSPIFGSPYLYFTLVDLVAVASRQTVYPEVHEHVCTH